MKVICALLTFSLFFLEALCQSNKARLLSTFPFKQLTGGVILLEARFDTLSTPFNFILDTGSGGISLDSTTVEEFDIEQVPSNISILGIAGARKVNFAYDKQLHLPGLTIDSLNFHINDYQLLSSVYGIPIDGIIGYSILKDHIVKIDFDVHQIHIYTPGDISYPRRGTSFYPVFTALPIVSLTVRDERTLQPNVYFDTGAGLCFLVTKRYATDSLLFKEKRKPKPVGVQGLGGKKLMEVTVVQKVKFGPYSFKRVPTYILDDQVNVISYPFLGGLLGNDLLRRFNIILNYPEKRIHLTPNSHYRDPFDYSYAGMNLYVVDGAIEVQDVIEGSPADEAGLKNGDVVVGINNNISGNITEYKDMLSKESRLTFIISRSGELLTLKLKTGRIY